MRFVLSAVAVEAQLRRRSALSATSLKPCARLQGVPPALPPQNHEALCTVKCFGMAGMHFSSTVQHLRSTIRIVVVDQAGPSDPAETATVLTPEMAARLRAPKRKASPGFTPLQCP